MSEFVARDLTMGQMNAIVKKIGGMFQAERFLRGELVISEATCIWHEHDGVVYFTITSNGKTGEEWIKHFESKRINIGDRAKEFLLSVDFKPSKKGTISEVAVIKGDLLSDDDRTTSKILEKARTHEMQRPNAEVACLIRDAFTDWGIKAMGLNWIVTMHESIQDSNGELRFLILDRYDTRSSLNACRSNPDDKLHCLSGFAFVVPQVN